MEAQAQLSHNIVLTVIKYIGNNSTDTCIVGC